MKAATILDYQYEGYTLGMAVLLSQDPKPLTSLWSCHPSAGQPIP